ncbi:sensor histidine kinase [Paenibacillus contaminans]|uniref:sensor histidine kinase n=1 Tax=Paenibacillus contaminans TaxID=450362 RepID=UPI001EDE4FD9|nr:HAMP domain-containing sensor histidine kinase [Paenibacillus contaminans]
MEKRSRIKSVRSRVVWSFVAVIVFIITVLGGLFIGTVKKYYYGSAIEAMRERASVTTAFYNQYVTAGFIRERARYIFENVSPDELAKIEVIDMSGRLVLDSNGFASSVTIMTDDVKQAMQGESGQWVGSDPVSHEKILALSNVLWENDRPIGIIRFTTSLTLVDDAIAGVTRLALAAGSIVILLSLAMSLLLARRIVKPIRELTSVAKVMAGGNFSKKAIIRHNDEIGHLADTLNYLSDEITKNTRLKNEFISSVSHELRTPLTSIKGWSETLLSGDLEDREETKLGLKVITKETERLIGLVEELLDFSKLQAGAVKIKRKSVDLNKLAADLGNQFQASGSRKGLVLSIELSKDALIISGDYNRLKQVLVNVIDNALKFTPVSGEVRLETSSDNKFAVIRVRDNGDGISPEDLPFVTDKFYKGGTSRPGNGLGLSISKELVEQHGGRLHLESRLNEGTVVTILLPLAK